MNRFFALMLMISLVLVSVNPAHSEWIPVEQIQKVYKEAGLNAWTLATNNGSMQYWAGVITHANFSTKEYRIRITHVTDRTSYKCGQVIELSENEVKEFTHRALLLRKCN